MSYIIVDVPPEMIVDPTPNRAIVFLESIELRAVSIPDTSIEIGVFI
jgi:hypothetical protein